MESRTGGIHNNIDHGSDLRDHPHPPASCYLDISLLLLCQAPPMHDLGCMVNGTIARIGSFEYYWNNGFMLLYNNVYVESSYTLFCMNSAGGSDYTENNSILTLSLASVTDNACFAISIEDDTELEGNEAFLLSFQHQPVPFEDILFFGIQELMITIIDNEGKLNHNCMSV